MCHHIYLTLARVPLSGRADARSCFSGYCSSGVAYPAGCSADDCSGQKEELARLSHTRGSPAREVQRARILCRFEAGETISQIARALRTTRPSVRKWVDKALAMGASAALKDTWHRPHAPVITEEAKAWLARSSGSSIGAILPSKVLSYPKNDSIRPVKDSKFFIDAGFEPRAYYPIPLNASTKLSKPSSFKPSESYLERYKPARIRFSLVAIFTGSDRSAAPARCIGAARC